MKPISTLTTFKRSIFICVSLLIITLKGLSQTRNDSLNISTNISAFRNWLSKSWSKDYLIYDTTEISDNKLYLSILLICSNNCTAKWNNLKRSFDLFSTRCFEENILDKASFLLELPRDSIIIRIYNKTTNEAIPCFYRGIKYNDSLIITSADCKDLSSQSTLDYQNFNPFFSMKNIQMSIIDKKANEILDFLYSKCYSYYKSKGPEIKIYRLNSQPYSITFEVRNLNNEVIPATRVSLFRSTEVLRFTISCNMHSSNAFFQTIINGKFGSDLLKPTNERGYNDMENEYKTELQNYVTEFSNNRLLEWLK